MDEEQCSPLKKKDPRKSVTFDDVLKVVGEFGKYQKYLYFLCSLPFTFGSMQLFGWAFVGAKLPHQCSLPDNREEEYENATTLSAQECSIVSTLDNSTVYTECPNGYDYDGRYMADSVVREWDLVCDHEGWFATVGAAPMVGYLIGGFILGELSDKWGRKPTFLLSIALMVGGGTAGAVAPDYYSFVVARGIVGFAISGLDNTCYCLGLELVGPTKRTQAGIICWFFETAGLLLALIFAYLIHDNWRALQFVYSIPAIVCLSYYWLVPESIRFQLQQGEYKVARVAIEDTAEKNGTGPLPEDLIDNLEATLVGEKGQVEGRIYTIVDLFRYPQSRIKTIILNFCQLVCASLYYVLLLDQSELSDDPFVGFFWTSIVQIPGYTYVLLTLERPAFGRKRSLASFLIFGGLSLILHPLTPANYPGVRMGISLFGRFCANCSYTTIYLWSAEQYPTVVRGIGMGLGCVVSRFGSILAPYILLLGHFSPVIFGVGSVLGGLACGLLPETLGVSLPETLEDGEGLKITLPFRSKASTQKEFKNIEVSVEDRENNTSTDEEEAEGRK